MKEKKVLNFDLLDTCCPAGTCGVLKHILGEL